MYSFPGSDKMFPFEQKATEAAFHRCFIKTSSGKFRLRKTPMLEVVFLKKKLF